MKKLLLIVSWLFIGTVMMPDANAQNGKNCGTMPHYYEMLQHNPEFAKAQAKAETQTLKLLAQNPNFRVAGGGVVIPVVFHVIYKTAVQNISDARIIEQLQVLNDDFAHLNADSGNTPVVFQGLTSNTGIQFCMAQRDPAGNASTGIVRVLTTVNSWTDDAVKATASGGDDAWPADDYLNIWVCQLGGGLLGYAQFPGGPDATDGVVVLNGSVGGPNAPGTTTSYNLGRTATHEVGHWVNLRHIWGDSNCGNDLVADTPTQQTSNFGCPAFPHITCSNGPNGDMFMNYMDYVDDDCMNMFTPGQAARMNALFNVGGLRFAMLASLGCTPVILQTTDAGVAGIVSPSGTVCSATITPEVILSNFGINALVSVTINYQVDAGPVNTFSWVGTLASGASVNVILPSVTVSAGAHTFTSYTSNPNGLADQNTANDSQAGNFNSAAVAAAIPYAEGFEVITFPPTGWTITNPDGATTWARSTAGHFTGTASMWIDNANYNANGEIDEMDMQPVDLSTVANPELTFQVAYTYWTVPYQFSDTLEVLISTDCGLNWISLYKNWGDALATAPGQSSDFTPTASQWRKESINLNAYAASTGAIIRFRNITDFENNLFIDDINVDNALGINEIKSDPSFSVYPIPSKGLINIQWSSLVKENISVTVTNSIGETVYSNEVKNYNGTLMKVDLSKKANGVYFVKVQSSDKVINQKIVLND